MKSLVSLRKPVGACGDDGLGKELVSETMR